MRPSSLRQLCLALALLVPGLAAAQNYPSQDIRLICAFPAGGGADVLVRHFAEKLRPIVNRTVIVENKAGAGGNIATEYVARAKPDGYTIYVHAGSAVAANQSLFKKLPYDPIRDFEPVSRLGTITLALIVNPSVPAASTQELIAYGKANPGKLTFGSGSSSSRLAAEMLRSVAGLDMVNVPYKSNPQAITDLLGGQIQLVFADIATTLPQARAGKVKALGVSSAQRSPLAPDLPTMQEAGVQGYELTAWFAAYVPAGTPEAVVDKLNGAMRTALADEAAAKTLLGAGIEPGASTPEELKAFTVAETEKWARIVKAAGIEPE